MKSALLAAIIATAAALPAFAETKVQLEVLDRQEIVSEDGETKVVYTAIEAAVPGDHLVYRITLTNTAAEPATAIGMTLPVDPHILIDPASITGAADIEARFSVDQGESFAAFSDLVVESPDGPRAATPDDLTHLRIGLHEIPGNTEISIEYAASVE